MKTQYFENQSTTRSFPFIVSLCLDAVCELLQIGKKRQKQNEDKFFVY